MGRSFGPTFSYTYTRYSFSFHRLDKVYKDDPIKLVVNSEIEDVIGSCFVSTLVCKRVDGLFPTVVCDEQGVCLGLVYSSTESIREAIKQAKGSICCDFLLLLL